MLFLLPAPSISCYSLFQLTRYTDYSSVALVCNLMVWYVNFVMKSGIFFYLVSAYSRWNIWGSTVKTGLSVKTSSQRFRLFPMISLIQHFCLTVFIENHFEAFESTATRLQACISQWKPEYNDKNASFSVCTTFGLFIFEIHLFHEYRCDFHPRGSFGEMLPYTLQLMCWATFLGNFEIHDIRENRAFRHRKTQQIKLRFHQTVGSDLLKNIDPFSSLQRSSRLYLFVRQESLQQNVHQAIQRLLTVQKRQANSHLWSYSSRTA